MMRDPYRDPFRAADVIKVEFMRSRNAGHRGKPNWRKILVEYEILRFFSQRYGKWPRLILERF